MNKSTATSAALAAIFLTTNVSAQPVSSLPPPSVVPAMLHIPEGTELTLTVMQPMSSASNIVGDAFTVKMDDPITIDGGGTIPGGLTGEGEVTSVHKRG